MTRWLAAPILLALVLAGCGQNASEAGSDLQANDCELVNEVTISANSWKQISDELATSSDNFYRKLSGLLSTAARTWPQISDADAKEIIKSLAEPAEITRGDGIRGISSASGQRILLAAESLSGWQIANCPD